MASDDTEQFLPGDEEESESVEIPDSALMESPDDVKAWGKGSGGGGGGTGRRPPTIPAWLAIAKQVYDIYLKIDKEL